MLTGVGSPFGVATVDHATVVRAEEPDAHVPGVIDVVAVDAGVEPPALRITHDGHRRREERAAVQLVVHRDRQAAEVDLVPAPHDLLDGRLRAVHFNGSVRRPPVEHGRVAGQLLERAVERQRHALVGGEQVGHAAQVTAGDIGEEEGVVAAFLVGPGAVGGDAEAGVHPAVDAANLTRSPAGDLVKKATQIFLRSS